MKFVIQRVTEAKCEIDQKITGQIGLGFCVLIGVAETDTDATADKMIRKLLGMRIFADESGKTNCKLRLNGTPVPLLRNGYSIFNGTKYR